MFYCGFQAIRGTGPNLLVFNKIDDVFHYLLPNHVVIALWCFFVNYGFYFVVFLVSLSIMVFILWCFFVNYGFY